MKYQRKRFCLGKCFHCYEHTIIILILHYSSPKIIRNYFTNYLFYSITTATILITASIIKSCFAHQLHLIGNIILI